MKIIRQTQIAKMIGISDSFLSQIMAGKKRPHWKTAKKLAKTTHTTPELWLDGSPEQIRKAIRKL